jgi:hypothetical protein
MAGIGLMVAKSLPPPGKLGKMKPAPAGDEEEGSAGEPADEAEGDQEAAELSLAEAFQSAVKDGSAEDVLSAFKDLRDACKGY